MKMLMLSLFALTVCGWGEVFVKDSIHVVFSKNILNPSWVADDECYVEKPYNKENPYHKKDSPRIFLNDFNCVNDVCSSILDSSVFFMEELYEEGDRCRYGFDYYSGDTNCSIFYFYMLSDATHSLMDVIRDEFRRFQECGYFDVTKEKLDSIFSDMDSILVPELEKERHYSAYVTECEGSSGCMTNCPNVGPCFIPTNGTSIDYILAKRNASISISYSVDFASRLAVEKGYLVVPANLEFREYTLYNLGGRVLRRGYLRNHMALPHQPVILRIIDYGDVYLK